MKTSSALPMLGLIGSGLALPAVSVPEARGILEEDFKNEYSVAMAFSGVVSTGGFAYKAVESCPPFAKGDDVKLAKCGISAVVALISGTFAGYQIKGLVEDKGPATNDRLFKRDALPYEDESVISGYRTTIDYHGTVLEADGNNWHQYGIQNYDIARDMTHNVTARFHPYENKQYVTTSIVTDSHSAFDKRQSFPVASYAWQDENESYFDSSNLDSDAVNRVGLSVWNHAHSGDLASFCADLETTGGTRWNKGFFALKPGQFTDLSGEC